MGRRSDFEPHPRNYYKTWDPRASPPLLTQLPPNSTFYEPCVGDGSLVRQLEGLFHRCVGASDIEPLDPRFPNRKDALELTELDVAGADFIITNPPFERKILHPMIAHFANLRPTWLLLDSEWKNTKQARPYQHLLKRIVVIGRLKWIENSLHDAKDSCEWLLFDAKNTGPTQFLGRLC